MFRLGFFLLTALMLVETIGKPASGESKPFEGDMVLTRKQNDLIQEAIDTGKNIDTIESKRYGATTAAFPKWTNGIVPYVLSPSLSRRAISAIKQGIAEWERSTCIRFRKRTTERNYLEFFKASGCWGHVGMGNGKSQISVGNGCEYRHVMTHEIGHALGFFHEQSRTDRDDYVKIEWSNIPSGLHSAFEKYGKDKLNSRGQPYDYGSIMHYPWNAFSTNGRNTLIPKRKVYQQPYRVLSKSDAIQAKLMYNCGGVKPKPVTKVPEPPEPPTDYPWTVKPVTECKDVVIEETVVVTVSSCRGDSRRNCRYWARRGECRRNPKYMNKFCCRSCGGQTSCQDKHSRCREWAARGECRKNPRYMLVSCAKSCGKCGTKTKIVRKKVRKCKVVPVTVMPPIPTTEPQSPPIPTEVPETGMPPIPTDKPETGMPPIPTDKPDTGMPPLPTDRPSTGSPPVKTGTRATTGPLPPVTEPPLPASCKATKKAGMEDGSLRDENLSASSSYNSAFSAASGRLGRALAWCAATSDQKQYLAIDIGKLAIVKGVITQGFDAPLPHFVKKFYVSYSEDNKLWNNVVGVSFWAIKEFTANADGRSEVKNSIDPPIVARYIKIHPIEWKNHICLRAELAVC